MNVQVGRKHMQESLSRGAVTFGALLVLSCILMWAEAPAAANPPPAPAATDTMKAAAPVGPAPKIHFPETVHNFGAIKQGDNAIHKFEVQNLGEAPLKLIRAKGT
jgi:hypothetical protein